MCVCVSVCVSTHATIYNIILHKTNENNNNKTNKININLVVCHVHSSLWRHRRRRDMQIILYCVGTLYLASFIFHILRQTSPSGREQQYTYTSTRYAHPREIRLSYV